MRKVFLGAAAALMLAILASYILIPSTIRFSKVTGLSTTSVIAERAFSDPAHRIKWWPSGGADSNNISGNRLTFEDHEYEFPQQVYSGSIVRIYRSGKPINSSLHFVSLALDSIAILWKSELPASNNPFKRISNYVSAISLKKDMAQLLDTVKVFLDKPENLYGLQIDEEKVKDTILLSTKWTSSSYPSTEIVYEKIHALQEHIRAQGGMETNHPMLHIVEKNGSFTNMVAIPVGKELPETREFVIKKMVAGRILTALVEGGSERPAEALQKIEQFIDDNNITSPAIPFESLITNRLQEKDSSKWKTKVYYPIQ